MFNTGNKLEMKRRIFIILTSLLIFFSLFLFGMVYLLIVYYYSDYDIFSANNYTNIEEILALILLVAFVFSSIISAIVIRFFAKPLFKLLEKERQIDEKRKEFIATISHELKTPITIIAGQLEGMIYNVGKYRDRDKYLMKCYENTTQMNFLVSQMLQLSKDELNITEINEEIVDLKSMVVGIVDSMSYLIDSKGQKVVYYFVDDNRVYVDKYKIEKVIHNIISNAIKYSPKNQEIHISVTRSHKGIIIGNKTDRLKLTVENFGISLSDEEIDEIYSPFFRTEKSRSRQTGGSGLGLYIVSKILDHHGLEYKMYSNKNSTVFKIYMPVK